MTAPEADQALAALLQATLEQESLMAARDMAIAAIQDRYQPKVTATASEISRLEADLEKFCRARCSGDMPAAAKHYDLAHGRVGLRAPATPALVPLTEKWSWSKIEKAVKRLWKLRYFHKPKPPALDKVAIKRDLTPAQLEKVGLKLDTTEHFYVELNRLSKMA
jgi:Bacteriophage Mu Gam like protein